ncbi:hypothetical protein ESP131_11100 [Exiguobacterium sp. U13-1]|uniref:DUF4129 domain-containing protein n=2 Tax=Exiguobacterium TaxID=33986 RepID=A0ABX8G6I7_EXIAC|nr:MULTISPECIES: hypothetical protein [Exiguobacterium]AOT00776.1 hypothetical protein ESP131_11100 [Exiguobacterium sp. U13-1]QWB28725.1 hypothetical protein KKI46_08915 [Exiguobacterium acetylicum]
MRHRIIGMTFLTYLVLFLGIMGVKLSYQALIDPPIDQSTGNWVHIPSKILPTKKVIYVKEEQIIKQPDSSKIGHERYRKEPKKKKPIELGEGFLTDAINQIARMTPWMVALVIIYLYRRQRFNRMQWSFPPRHQPKRTALSLTLMPEVQSSSEDSILDSKIREAVRAFNRSLAPVQQRRTHETLTEWLTRLEVTVPYEMYQLVRYADVAEQTLDPSRRTVFLEQLKQNQTRLV